MDRPIFGDHLEAIKFICKYFCSELFKKQIDILKTNPKGTFVFQDNPFRWLTRLSVEPTPESPDASDDPESKAVVQISFHSYPQEHTAKKKSFCMLLNPLHLQRFLMHYIYKRVQAFSYMSSYLFLCHDTHEVLRRGHYLAYPYSRTNLHVYPK
uniref:Uncharacterized protein n=1 Tax=Kalanchoe fedtschenkoi TaxID=63787 RepID=A0A7N0UM36_KALFE